MEMKITAYVLLYLLENRFESKAEMARKLGMQKRTLGKVFENLNIAKASTIAFEKAVEYCAENHISLDCILESFLRDTGSGIQVNCLYEEAYKHLNLAQPPGLSAEGEEVFISMLQFLRMASVSVCPRCSRWCDPWSGTRLTNRLDCYIGYMAREITTDTAKYYTRKWGTGHDSD